MPQVAEQILPVVHQALEAAAAAGASVAARAVCIAAPGALRLTAWVRRIWLCCRHRLSRSWSPATHLVYDSIRLPAAAASRRGAAAGFASCALTSPMRVCSRFVCRRCASATPCSTWLLQCQTFTCRGETLRGIGALSRSLRSTGLCVRRLCVHRHSLPEHKIQSDPSLSAGTDGGLSVHLQPVPKLLGAQHREVLRRQLGLAQA